ncbi:MAG: ABC transporter ATP-binding protein [Rhizobiaceae bacterium]
MSEPTTTEDIVLRADGLSKDFAGFKAVNDVSIGVLRGSIHALIGPNGAGKTTCFNLLTRFLPPSSGTITYETRDITRTPPAAVARMGLVRSFQISAIFPKLSVLENVRIAIQSRRGMSFDFWRSNVVLNRLDEEALGLLAMIDLDGMKDLLAGELSYGRKRALEIATTIALQPKVILLDEPMAGIGHGDIERIVEIIRTVAKGRTVLMIEHNLSVVAALAETITVLARGKVIAEGPYEAVSADPLVKEAYIGTAHGH